MIYDFDALPDRRNTESAKWNYFEPDVMPMWVADMDFISPEPVVRALQERVAHGVFGYAGNIPGLREVIVERMAQNYQWRIQPEDIVFIPGVVTGFNLAAHAFLRPEDGVLFQTPVYMPFLDVARNVGGLRQEMELTQDADGSVTIDFQSFEKSITGQTRMFLMCNPHNPVGRVFTRQELESIAEICARNDLIICSDEIHCDLVYSGHKHIPIASINQDAAQRTITVMAPSKTFNVAGLSCSFAIIQNPQLRQAYIKADKGLVHGVNLMGLVAARAAYQGGQEWLDQLLVYLEGNRDLLVRFVNEELPGVRMASPQGTYLAWLDCRQTGIVEKPGEFFLGKARVAVTEGAAFGKGGEGFIRLNFGCPRPMLVQSLHKMKEALESR